MKRKILCIMLVCCLLLFAGCREPVPPLVNTTATEPSIAAVEPTAGTTETTTVATEPEETQATEAATVPTGAQATETTSTPTYHHSTQEASSTQGLELTESSAVEVETTQPWETGAPQEETAVSDVPTEETVINLDCEAAMNIGNQYGTETYGWIVDLSLNESNAGFNFGSWSFAEDGQAALDAAGIGQIDFLYNSLKAAYPDMEITGIRFRVHAFACGDGLYEVRVYYA